jgi:hypothetical protein
MSVAIWGILVALLGVLVLAAVGGGPASSRTHVPTKQVTTVYPPGVVHSRREYQPTQLRTLLKVNENYRPDGSLETRSIHVETEGSAVHAWNAYNHAQALVTPPTQAITPQYVDYIDGEVIDAAEQYPTPRALPYDTGRRPSPPPRRPARRRPA